MVSPSSLSSLSVSPKEQSHYLQNLLDSALPFLRDELDTIDPNLPSIIAILRSAGTGECWHKHGDFLQHLIGVYRILHIWKAPPSVRICGLFHSAYPKSDTNLAIYDPSTGRDTVRSHVGEESERLMHLFCVIPRLPIIYNDLLFHYSDSELVEHLNFSELSLWNAKEKGIFNGEEGWRKKLQTLLPPEGITVKHIRTGEDVHVSRRIMAVFLLITVADFSEQLYGFQDALYDNSNGRLEYSGNNFETLWPGDGKPGLWLNLMSRIAALYRLIVREEELFMEEKKRKSGNTNIDSERDEDLELVVPPIFENCTRVIDAKDQIVARDLYFEAVCGDNNRASQKTEELLKGSIEKNPYVGEPRVVLSQVYLSKGRYEEAEKEAERGLTLLLEWGSPWDKRNPWGGWISWARVMLTKAKENSWPNISRGISDLGHVK